MSTSGDGTGLFVGLAGLAFGASKATAATKAKEDLKLEQSAHKASVQMGKDAIKERDETIESLTSHLNTANSDNQNLKSQLQAQEGKIRSLQKDCDEHVREKRSLDAMVSDLTNRVEIERTSKEGHQRRASELETEVANVREERDIARTQLAEAQAEIERLRGEPRGSAQ